MTKKADLKSFQSKLFPIILICFLGAVIYSNTFSCSFHLEDNNSIVPNLAIHNVYNLRAIWDFWPTRFLTYFTLAVNYHISKLDVWSYHLFNLLVHLGSSILVWYLTLLTFSTPALRKEKIAQYSKLIALFAGLVFVSSPIQTQGVTYIVQRAVSMATLFYLASLALYVRSRLLPEGKSYSESRAFYYAGSLIAAILAMFTKEMTITLPFMIWLYEFSFLNDSKKRINWKNLMPFFLTLAIIPLTMIMTRSVNIAGMHRAVEPSAGISQWHYLLTEFRVLVTYIRLVFIPLNQNLDYAYPVIKTLLNISVLASMAFLSVILTSAFRAFRNYRLVSFGIFWFFLTLLPESSIIPIMDVIFEHRLYLPMAGFSIFLASGSYYLFKERRIKAMAITLSLLVAAYSILTYERNKLWKDEFTLWSDVINKSPLKARGYNIRGHAYRNQGNLNRTIPDLTMSIEMDPTLALSYNIRGQAYRSKGDLDRAMADYNKGIELDPGLAMSYYNRGNAYQGMGEFDKAIVDYNKAIEIDPKYVDAYNNRGNAYQNKGDFDRAIADYSKAIEINPDFADAYNNRNIAYGKKEGFNKTAASSEETLTENAEHVNISDKVSPGPAISDYNKLKESGPDSASYHNNLGVQYGMRGDLDGSISEYNKAIDLDPKYAKAYNNRGNAYQGKHDLGRAVSDYNKAIDLDPKYIDAYNNRGNAYQDMGVLDKAIADYDKVIELDPKYAKAYNNRGNIYRSKNDLDNAVADYDKAIELDPKYAIAYNNRGIAYQFKGDNDRALSSYNKVIELDPNIAITYNNRAVIYFEEKKYDKCWKDIRKAQALGYRVPSEFIEQLQKIYPK